MYLGDLERLRDIQIKRDKTNRDWQRIILRNVGKSLGWDMDVPDDRGDASSSADGPHVMETRQLWWNVHNKMQNPEYGNMLLLAKMEDWLEEIMFSRGQKYITKNAYEKMVRNNARGATLSRVEGRPTYSHFPVWIPRSIKSTWIPRDKS